jgi:putative nucleotidyltransferase with HDIG domain
MRIKRRPDLTTACVPNADQHGAASRFCRTYVLLVFTVGSVAIVSAVRTVSEEGVEYGWLALGVCALVGGSFRLKVPRVQATLTLSEVFVFTTILCFGYGPATLIVTTDGLITSLRGRSRSLLRVLFNVGEPALSVWLAWAVFRGLSGLAPLAEAPAPITRLAVPVLIMSVAYFLVNSSLNAVAVVAERGGSPYRIWRTHFAWLVFNDLASASIALFISMHVRQVSVGGILAALPLLVLLYVALRTSLQKIEHAHAQLAQLNRMHVATVESLAMAVDARDHVTHGHIRRVQTYALALAERVGVADPAQLKAIEVAALLHDTGKLAVPDHILNKPGKLTACEYDTMKRHAVIGADMLSTVDFPYPVVPIVRHHHENWDGSGYPEGLRDTQIPLGARILSVIDCYDALTSDRPYRPALRSEEAVAIIQQRRGSMYDPDIVDAFVRLLPRLPEAARARGPSTVPSVPAPVGGAHDLDTGMGTKTCWDELLAIGELADTLTGRASLDDTAELLVRHVRRLTPASTIVVYVPAPDGKTLTVAYASGPGEHVVRDMRLHFGRGLSGWIAATRTTMVNADPTLDLGSRIDWISPRLRSALCAPLVSSDVLEGVLALYADSPDMFTAAHSRRVRLVSGPLAAALAGGRQFDAHRTRTLDPVTGLPGTQYLSRLTEGNTWLERASPHSRVVVAIRAPWTAVPADANVSLRMMAAVREAADDGDLIFHHGPGLVVLSDGDRETALRMHQRILARCAELRVTGDRPVTVGFACAPADGRRWDDLVAVACARRGAAGPEEEGLRRLSHAHA